MADLRRIPFSDKPLPLAVIQVKIADREIVRQWVHINEPKCVHCRTPITFEQLRTYKIHEISIPYFLCLCGIGNPFLWLVCQQELAESTPKKRLLSQPF